jgi:hypothetical protein
MSKARDFFIILVCAAILASIGGAWYFEAGKINSIIVNLKATTEASAGTLSEAKLAAGELRTAAAKETKFIDDQQFKFNNDKTQENIGLLLRIGKPLTEEVLAARAATDELKFAIHDMREQMIKPTGQTIDQLRLDLHGNAESFHRLVDAGANSLGDFDKSLQWVNQQEQDPRTAKAIDQTYDLIDNFHSYAPPAMKAGVGILQHGEEITGELAGGLHDLRKPKTFKQQLFSAAGKFVLGQAPIIITTIFKR